MIYARRQRNLHAHEVEHLKNSIDASDPRRAQKTLQLLCKLDRDGVVVSQKDRGKLETVLLGVLHKGTSDEPVRRWTLNALAIIGSEQISLDAIVRAISTFSHEPQVTSAAIAAIYSIDKHRAPKLIAQKDVLDPKLVGLSALQATKKGAVFGSDIVVDIENDPAIVQKLALIVIGLDKAPPNLFHPSYSNREIVKILSRDGEPMVSQYAVWATMESDELSASDLGIPFEEYIDQPVNVQAYIHRLYAAKADEERARHEVVVNGITSDERKIRLETAIGLRETFYDGLESIISDQIIREPDDEVREQLNDHIVLQSDKCNVYERLALEFYEAAEQDNQLRQRMRAAATGLSIYGHFRKLEVRAGEGFFGQPTIGNIVVNNNSNHFDNNGPIQGLVNQGGQAVNYGAINNEQIVENPEQAKETINRALTDVSAVDLEASLKSEAIKTLTDASNSPTISNLSKSESVLKRVQESLKAVAGSSEAVVKIAGHAALVAALLV